MKSKLLFLAIISLSLRTWYGQSRPSIKACSYLVMCESYLTNGRPVVTYLVSEDLSFLTNLKPVDKQEDFLCHLLKTTVLFEEPAFTISKNRTHYHFSSKDEGDLFLGALAKKISDLNGKYFSIPIKFSGNIYINLKVAKIDGEFWKINKTDWGNLNPPPYVDSTCYLKDYKYNLKDIHHIYKLKKRDILTQAHISDLP